MLLRLWAVARQTFLECVRTRILPVFMGLLVAGMLAIAFTGEGDGTLKGRIQTFLAYSIALTQLLLALATIFLATSLVGRDVHRKSIYTVVTKPIHRWQYVVGRFIGVVMLDLVLLAAALGAIYGLAQYLHAQPTLIEQKIAQQRIAPDTFDIDRNGVDNEVFVSRIRRLPDPMNVDERFQARWRQLEEEKGPAGMAEMVRDRLARKLQEERTRMTPGAIVRPEEVEAAFANALVRDEVILLLQNDVRGRIADELRTIQPGQGQMIEFSGLYPGRGEMETLQVTYKLNPLRQPESRMLSSLWHISNKENGFEWSLPRTDSIEMRSSLLLPHHAVTTGGRLTMFYVNIPGNEPTPVKLMPDELAVYYRAGTFEGNLLRCGLLVLAGLMFLAAVSVLLGVCVSFPVACLVCVAIYGVGLMGGFVLDATRLGGQTPTTLEVISHYLARGVFTALPSLAKVSPTEAMVEGAGIPWAVVGSELGLGIGLRATLALALGCLIFWRRELARVQV